MTRIKGKAWLVLSVIFYMLNFSIQAEATTVTLEPLSQDVSLGNSFGANITVNGVIDMSGFQFKLNFDPNILKAIKVTEGPFLSSGGYPTFFSGGGINNTTGTTGWIFSATLGPGSHADGSGTLAAVAFDALGTGISPLNLSNVILVNTSSLPIPADVINGSVNVVPEPVSVMLFLTGGAVLAARRFRRKA